MHTYTSCTYALYNTLSKRSTVILWLNSYQKAELHLALKFSCLLPATAVYTLCSVVETSVLTLALRTGLLHRHQRKHLPLQSFGLLLSFNFCWGN